MRRVISLWLPTFQTDRLHRLSWNGVQGGSRPDAPLVIAEKVKAQRQVAALNAAARDAGLRVGMGIAHAGALQPGLIIADANPHDDNRALASLASWLLRYSPLVALDPPDGLWLDVGGCAHLFGGEQSLLARLHARLAEMGFDSRAAVADTPGAAHAAARFAEGGVVSPGECERAIHDLPIAALRLAKETVLGLQGLGFTTIRQLLEAPRAPLTRRFGAMLFLRLDQALGRIGETLQPIDPPPIPRCRRVFVDPIATAESLAQVSHDLAGDMCAVLEPLGQGARRLDLVFERIDGARLAICIGTARPTRDPQHIARLLTEQLGTIEPGLGIEAMALSAPLTDPLDHSQISTLAESETSDLAGLVDRLSNRLGARHLWRAVPLKRQIPERSLRRAWPLDPAARLSWPSDLPRPVRLIDPPERIEVIAQAPDYPPATFTWRGQRHRVRLSDGLERIYSEWWAGDALYGVRDYFRVEVEKGGRYWLFRSRDEEQPAAATPHWFIHGAFA